MTSLIGATGRLQKCARQRLSDEATRPRPSERRLYGHSKKTPKQSCGGGRGNKWPLVALLLCQIVVALLLPLDGSLICAATGSARANNAPSAAPQAQDDEQELSIGAGGADLSPARHHDDERRLRSSANKRSALAADRAADEWGAHADLLAFTFDDYVREAARAHQHDSGGGGGGDEGEQARVVLESGESGEGGESASASANDSGKQTETAVASDSKAERTTASVAQRAEAPVAANASETADTSSTASAELAPNEIKLLFAWRSLSTNKCSRDCAGGFRLNHLSCIDLKFNVRVEDELCLRAQLAKPAELNLEEPCNEEPCAPQWVAVESPQCFGAECASRAPLYKRVECVRLEARGKRQRVDESLCANTSSPDAQQQQQHDLHLGAGSSLTDELAQHEFSVDISARLDKESNEIAHHSPVQSDANSAAGAGPLYQLVLSNAAAQHSNGEPFYQAHEWSECTGAPCGQLGTRARNLTCRLYLARSAKFVALPASSCQALGVQAPHTHEPCYMDCGPGGDAQFALVAAGEQTGAAHQQHQQDDLKDDLQDNEDNELTYQLDEAQRFAWRHSGWTKCSAECLGGTRESLVECWDKVAEQAVSFALCEQQLAVQRPKPLLEQCNQNVACAPEWRLEPFGECSRPCGSAGVRTRSLACVQLVPLETGHSSYMLVANELCLQASGATGQVPHSVEPCNRLDCRPEWSLGPWSECLPEPGLACPLGRRNRTLICLQEFAKREGPTEFLLTGGRLRTPEASNELREALELASKHWHPAKATQVPARECFDQYKSLPQLSERCQLSASHCGDNGKLLGETITSKTHFIDSDLSQDFRTPSLEENSTIGANNNSNGQRRRSVTLRIGGRAQLAEGRTLKIRCRLMSASGRQAPSGTQALVQWFKDGLRIFGPNSSFKTVERQQVGSSQDTQPDEDNAILTSDLLVPPTTTLNDQSMMMAADEPDELRRARNQQHKQQARKLRVRSSLADLQFQFVARSDGRFSLANRSTLKIKRLRLDDSGIYTCMAGQLSESLELSVVGRRRHESQLATNGETNNY